MQEIVAPVDGIKFEIELALDLQKGAQPLPFPGMDKSGAAICTYFLTSVCNKGATCPFRHIKGDRSVVCKHWLRGLCKKGDDCEFLHEFDMSKMPECFFFSKFGFRSCCGDYGNSFPVPYLRDLKYNWEEDGCSNKECPFLHIDPKNKVRDCPWYDRGFCRHGPLCKNRHVRRVICQCYLNGFCLDGPNCKYVHPTFKIPDPDPVYAQKKQSIVCHLCMQPGHKAIQCHAAKQSGINQLPGDETVSQNHIQSAPHPPQYQQMNPQRERRPLDQITCFKCGEKGHFANRCPKGHLAFLSAANYANQNSNSTS